MKRSIQALLITSAFGAGLLVAPELVSADKLSDFKRAANSSKCRLSPYSGIRSNCKSAFNRGKDKAKKTDCRKLGTRVLIALLNTNKRLLDKEKNKKKKDRSRISKLKDEIRKLKRKIEKNKSRANRRAGRAQNAATSFQTAKTVMGGPLTSKLRADVAVAKGKADGESDKSKKAKKLRRAAEMRAAAAAIRGKAGSFRDKLKSRQRKANDAAKLCRRAARGDY